MSADLTASLTNTSWGGCVVKGVQRDNPTDGGVGVSPRFKKSPKIGGLGG